MVIYLDVVMLLNFLVDWLLLMGANRLCGHAPRPGRTALAALLGGLYGGVCLVPGFRFLSGILWRLVFLALMAVIAYGICLQALRRGVVFLLLSMALGGICTGMTVKTPWTVVLSAVTVGLLCAVGFRRPIGKQAYIPVELTYGSNRLKLTALQDTGNTLRDPVTGSPVLVVDGDSARKLTGLTDSQLRQPVQTMGILPGLRLIPYRAVGTEGGLLLALKLPQVKIGSWQGSQVVAFAPEQLSADGEYQALTGGMA